MRALFCFAFALVLIALQAALLHYLGGGAVPLAMALPIVVYLGLHADNVEGAVASAAIGYLLDVTAGSPKGLMVFLAVTLFLFSRLAAASISIQGRLGFALLSGAGTFLFGSGALLLTRAVSPLDSAPGPAMLVRVLLEALATGLAAPLVLLALGRVERFFSREETGLLR